MDRQRILVLFGIAWISAAGLTWFLYAKTKAPKAERKVAVMAAIREMPIGTLIRKTDLRQIALLEKDIPKGAIFRDHEALNRVLLFPVTVNEPLTVSKLSAPGSAEGISSTIEPGHRAVSVQITDVSGVAGLIQPNSRVDVLFTRPGSMAEAITSTILQNVKVLSIGRVTQVGQAVDPRAPKMPVVTLVLKPSDAQKLELAKNEGKISLTLRNPLDETRTDGAPVTTEILDPMVSARLARARKGRTTTVAKANLEDPRVWRELTGDKKDPDEEARKKREADKPRVVVDVFRGDKHVQELFR